MAVGEVQEMIGYRDHIIYVTDESQVGQDTLAAYCSTNFKVFGDHPFVINVGKKSHDLASLPGSEKGAAYVTAFNPLGELIDDLKNQTLQNDLLSWLDCEGYGYINGIGIDPQEQWPGEDSVLILGIDLESAAAVGNRFNQNAVVWAGADAVPKLIMLR